MENEKRLFLVYQRVNELLYGSVSVLEIDGSQADGNYPLEFSNPYIISKQLGDREVIYGSVLHLIDEVVRPLFIMEHHVFEQQRKASPLGRHSYDVTSRTGKVLTYSTPPDLSPYFYHKQEQDIKDAILLSGLHLRTLMEDFNGRRNVLVPFYDYEGKLMGEVWLSKIINTLSHHRYCVISGEFAHDIFSKEMELVTPRLFGAQIRIAELCNAIISFVTGITITDFAWMLHGRLRRLRIESAPRDIMFALQNVHSLAQIIEGRIFDSRSAKFLEFLLANCTAAQSAKFRNAVGDSDRSSRIPLCRPQFMLGSNLSEETIEMYINVEEEVSKLEFTQKEFFGELVEAYGREPMMSFQKLGERFEKLTKDHC